jgi:hypothetical protein
VPEHVSSSIDETTGEHIYEEIILSVGELNRTTTEDRMYENIT